MDFLFKYTVALSNDQKVIPDFRHPIVSRGPDAVLVADSKAEPNSRRVVSSCRAVCAAADFVRTSRLRRRCPGRERYGFSDPWELNLVNLKPIQIYYEDIGQSDLINNI